MRAVQKSSTGLRNVSRLFRACDKKALCQDPVLCSPDLEKSFIVEAEEQGLGTVLLQGETGGRTTSSSH